MLARALYADFDVLLLDEAFSELDAPSERQILFYLKQYARAGKIVVLITHNAEALNLCDRIINLDMQYA